MRRRNECNLHLFRLRRDQLILVFCRAANDARPSAGALIIALGRHLTDKSGNQHEADCAKQYQWNWQENERQDFEAENTADKPVSDRVGGEEVFVHRRIPCCRIRAMLMIG